MRISDWSSDVCSSALGFTPDCDILFLGRMPVADRRQLIAWVRGRAVLTITDDDAACIYGAMFCLSSHAASLSFSVHLDAIGRGPLRVDPRVLRIGSGQGGHRLASPTCRVPLPA